MKGAAFGLPFFAPGNKQVRQNADAGCMRTGCGSGSGNGGQHNYREAGRKNRTKNGLRRSYRIAKRYKTGVDYRDAGLKTRNGIRHHYREMEALGKRA